MVRAENPVLSPASSGDILRLSLARFSRPAIKPVLIIGRFVLVWSKFCNKVVEVAKIWPFQVQGLV